MDSVFKRYSGPFFLDYCIQNNNLSNFIDTLIDRQDEEKLWELYLATLPLNEKTFNEWKQEIMGKSKKEYKNIKMTQKEIDTTIKKSQDILKNFKPPQKGGEPC